MKIRIGSRGSDLALWQANFVKDQLEELGHEVAIEIIKTRGDIIQDLSFDKIEGKGFFTKEIEDALLNEKVDVAVHSYKDLETTSPEGLTIGAVSYRENPSDSVLVRKMVYSSNHPFGLDAGHTIGTSSARRQSLIHLINPSLQIKELRGNVPTRVEKLRSGEYDAIILATAGLNRLNLDLSDLEVLELPVNEFVPAPAQGVLGIQIREKDTEIAGVISKLHNEEVEECISLERGILRQMDGGCQLPLGVHVQKVDDLYEVFTSFAPSKSEPAVLGNYMVNEVDEMAAELAGLIRNGE